MNDVIHEEYLTGQLGFPSVYMRVKISSKQGFTLSLTQIQDSFFFSKVGLNQSQV